MSSYQIAIGHDVALVDLDLLVPQPRSGIVKATRRTTSGNRKILDEGLYLELRYNVLGSPATYSSLLTQFGVNGSNTTRDVTIYGVEYQFAYNRFNGVAVRPQLGEDADYDNFFIRDIIFLITDLEYAL